MPLIEKIVFIFIFLTGLIIVLKHFNYDILSLVTALGVTSLAIGLAAKDTLANMISGFTLMLDRPFRVGDRVQLASGEIGDVVEISETRPISRDKRWRITKIMGKTVIKKQHLPKTTKKEESGDSATK